MLTQYACVEKRVWTGVKTYTHLEILTKFHTIKKNVYHAWHHQQNLLCLWSFTILSPSFIPISFYAIIQNCVYNHNDSISPSPQDRWASDSCSTPVNCNPETYIVLEDKKWAAGRKLSITVSHLRNHLKDYIDLEGLPLLVALKDALIYFQL